MLFYGFGLRWVEKTKDVGDHATNELMELLIFKQFLGVLNNN